MARPRLFLLGPGHYSYRVEFRFVNAAGDLLESKTWNLHQERDEPPQVLLLQANAKLIGDKPELEEWGPNYVTITTVVDSLANE